MAVECGIAAAVVAVVDGRLILVKFFGPQSFNSSKLRFIFFFPVKSSLGYH